MRDDEERRLLRARGPADDEARWLAARLRRGTISRGAVEVAAALEYQPARLVLADGELRRWSAGTYARLRWLAEQPWFASSEGERRAFMNAVGATWTAVSRRIAGGRLELRSGSEEFGREIENAIAMPERLALFLSYAFDLLLLGSIVGNTELVSRRALALVRADGLDEESGSRAFERLMLLGVHETYVRGALTRQ